MFDLRAYGLDPEKAKAMQEVTGHIQVAIRRSPKQGQFRVLLTSDGDPRAQEVISALVSRLTSDLLSQLYAIFAMPGRMVDVD